MKDLMTNPAVSPHTVTAVIPCFNGAAFVDSALASIAGQITPPDEVVFVDDASSDDSVERAEAWQDRLPLRIIAKPQNEGLGPARHSGISVASGSVIAPLDVDDVWLPDHLSALTALIVDENTIVTPGTYNWHPGTALATVPSFEVIAVPPQDQQRLEIVKANFLFSGSLFSKSAYTRSGGYRDMRKNEDWDLWIRMVDQGCRAVAAHSVTVLYRQHEASLSAADGCLAHDIAMLESLVEERVGDERKAAQSALRRRRARVHMVDGFNHAGAGRAGAARRSFLRAAAIDRSLSGGRTSRNGSVLLRALPGVVSPERTHARRVRHLGDPDLGHGSHQHSIPLRPDPTSDDIVDLTPAADIRHATHPVAPHTISALRADGPDKEFTTR